MTKAIILRGYFFQHYEHHKMSANIRFLPFLYYLNNQVVKGKFTM